jgi:hypothetical protein
MEKKKFRFGAAVSSTFQFIVKFPKYVILPMLVQIIFSLVNMILNFHVPFFGTASKADRITNSSPFTPMTSSLRSLYSFAFMFLSTLVAFIILNGYIHIIKNWIDQKIEPEWNDFFTWNFSLFGQYIVLSMLIGFRAFPGFLLLIIPGIIILSKYIFAPYALIDQNYNNTDSLDRSTKLVKGVNRQVFGLIFLYMGLIISPTFFLSYTYYTRHNASLLPYVYFMAVLSPLIMNISQVVLSYLYFDLSAQQVELDKHHKETKETVPLIPLEALLHPESIGNSPPQE